MIKCQVCGYDNPVDGTSCLNCGSPMERPKVSDPQDDIDGEATIMLGMPTRSNVKPPVIPGSAITPPSAPPGSRAPMTPVPTSKPQAPAGYPPPPPPLTSRPAAPAAPFSGGMPPPPPLSPQRPSPPSFSSNAGPGPTITPAAPIPGTGGAMLPPKTNTLALVSVITGALSLPLCCCFPLWVTALITGFMGKKQIAESNGTQTGEKLALAGMVCGSIGLVLFILWLIARVAGASWAMMK